MDVIEIVKALWGSVPLELIIVIGLITALVKVTGYFIQEINKKEAKIAEMTAVLIESSNILNKLIDNIDIIKADQERILRENKESIAHEIKLEASNLKGEIVKLLYPLRKGEHQDNGN